MPGSARLISGGDRLLRIPKGGGARKRDQGKKLPEDWKPADRSIALGRRFGHTDAGIEDGLRRSLALVRCGPLVYRAVGLRRIGGPRRLGYHHPPGRGHGSRPVGRLSAALGVVWRALDNHETCGALHFNLRLVRLADAPGTRLSRWALGARREEAALVLSA
jgi:hypothetical protein